MTTELCSQCNTHPVTVQRWNGFDRAYTGFCDAHDPLLNMTADDLAAFEGATDERPVYVAHSDDGEREAKRALSAGWLDLDSAAYRSGYAAVKGARS